MKKPLATLIIFSFMGTLLQTTANAAPIPELILNSAIPAISASLNETVKFGLPQSVSLSAHPNLSWRVRNASYVDNPSVQVPVYHQSNGPGYGSDLFGIKFDVLGRQASITFTVRLAGKYSIQIDAVDGDCPPYSSQVNSCKTLAQKSIALNFVPGGEEHNKIYPLPPDSESAKLSLEISDPGSDSFGFVRVHIERGLNDGPSGYFVRLVTNDIPSQEGNYVRSGLVGNVTYKITRAQYLRDKLAVSLEYDQIIPDLASWSGLDSISRISTVPIVMNFQTEGVSQKPTWNIFERNFGETDIPVAADSRGYFFAMSPMVKLQFETDVKAFPATADCLITADRVEGYSGSKWVPVSDPVYAGDSCSDLSIGYPDDELRTPYSHLVQLNFGTYSGLAKYRIMEGSTYGLSKAQALYYDSIKPKINFGKKIGEFTLFGPAPEKPIAVPKGKADKSSNAYKKMFNVGKNFARVITNSDTALSQCTSALRTGAINANGHIQYLGVQARMIQSFLKTASGFQGCKDGFGH